MKIALTSCGGSGKTTLASDYSKVHNVPVVRVNTRDFMPEGVSSHLQVLEMATESPQEGIEFQSTLITKREELFRKTEESFISDRSVLDSFVYYSIHNSMFDTEENERRLYSLTLKSLQDVDVTVMLNPKLGHIDNNGVRTTGMSYYHSYNAIVHSFMRSSITPDYNYQTSLSDTISISVFGDGDTFGAFLFEPLGFADRDLRVEALDMVANIVANFKGNHEL